jgi:hypothetical protein
MRCGFIEISAPFSARLPTVGGRRRDRRIADSFNDNSRFIQSLPAASVRSSIPLLT